VAGEPARSLCRLRLMGTRALWAAVVLAAAGLWQIEQGAWLFVKARLAQVLLHRAWARTLSGEQEVKPWPWADTWPVARLLAPKHNVDLIVLAGANGRTLAFGPGVLETRARAGWEGTAVLTGHRDTHFRFLERLAPGDEIQLQAPRAPPRRYRVEAIEVVDARATRVVHDDETPTLVLVTCYPFEALLPGGPLRYIVTALAVEGA
jgi:sortase A